MKTNKPFKVIFSLIIIFMGGIVSAMAWVETSPTPSWGLLAFAPSGILMTPSPFSYFQLSEILPDGTLSSWTEINVAGSAYFGTDQEYGSASYGPYCYTSGGLDEIEIGYYETDNGVYMVQVNSDTSMSSVISVSGMLQSRFYDSMVANNNYLYVIGGNVSLRSRLWRIFDFV